MLNRALITLLILLLPTWSFAAKTTFVDGNAAAKSPGTKVTAAFLNSVNTHRHDGKAVDGSGVLDYAVDSGSANAIAIALSPALTAHVDGMPIYVKVAAANSGATTVAVNALAAVPLYKNVNQALQANDIRAGQIIGISYAAGAYQLLNYQPQDASTLNGATAAQLAPPGMVSAFYMPACPSGWLTMDGHEESRTTRSALYNAIGTIGGVGDGSTTFNVPDVRGYFLRSWSNGTTIDAGRVFGSTQADDFKAHAHTTYHATGGSLTSDRQLAYGTVGQGDESEVTNGMQPAGGTETRPRNIAVQYCIKY